MANYKAMVQWAFLIATNIISAFYIHVSEARNGNKSNIIWQLAGFILGFLGFLAYCLWNIMIKSGFFIDEETKA